MSALISTKPYMIRAIHEWCVDNGLTPHLLVAVNAQTRVPMGFVKDGEIVLNINYSATKDLHIDNDAIVFSARFGGVSHQLYVPIAAVKGVFAKENSQGMFFEIESSASENFPSSAKGDEQNTSVASASKKGKPTLTIVK